MSSSPRSTDLSACHVGDLPGHWTSRGACCPARCHAVFGLLTERPRKWQTRSGPRACPCTAFFAACVGMAISGSRDSAPIFAQRALDVTSGVRGSATQRTEGRAFINNYVQAALDGRESQGLPRRVEDRNALQRVQELLEPAPDQQRSRGATSVA